MLTHLENTGTVNIARTGTTGGSPLVLLHPLGMDLTWWGDQFREFGPERDVIAMDMPGHGLSAQPDAPPTFDMMADAMEALLESIGGKPAHLVGLSVGGMIAQTLALRRPDLVQSLTLVGTLCTFPDEIRKVLLERARIARTEGMARIAQLSNERWFTPAFRASRPDMLSRSTVCLLRQSGEFHARMWEMVAGLDLEHRLGAIGCPTMVITGVEDINAPPAAAQRIAHAIPGAVVRLMPGLGHFPPFEAPDAFNAILRAFLAEVEG